MPISDSYPHDVGIEADPAVILVERFQDTVAAISNRLIGTTTTSAGFVTEPTATTGQSFNTAAMTIPVDAPALSSGTTCLQMSATGGGVTQGTFYHNLGVVVPAGYNELYVRYYVKYPSGGTRHHNGLWILGQNPASNFLPSTTGQPNGGDFFFAALEPEHPLSSLGFDMYTSWMNMHANAEPAFVGNTFIPGLVVLNADQWYCIECRIKMNGPTITDSNGELQMWVDGVEIINLREGSPLGSWAFNEWTTGAGSTPFEGFRWRSTTGLAINSLWLNHLSDFNGGGVTTTMRWSHLVVATSRIGMLTPGLLAVTPGAYAVTGTDTTLTHQAVHSWLRVTGGTVSFSSAVQDGTLYVNGLPFFPHGFYHVSWTGFPPNTDGTIIDMHTIAAAGFNTMACAKFVSAANWQLFLDECAASNMMIISEDVEDGEKQFFVDKAAHLGFVVADDANYPCGAAPAGKNAVDVLARHNTIKTIDPTHVTWISGPSVCGTLGTSWVGYMNPPGTDLIGLQAYVIGNPGVDPNPLMEVYLTLRNSVNQAVPYGRPMIASPQTFMYPGERWPTTTESRAFTYGALLAGCKGIINYTYLDSGNYMPDQPAFWAEQVLQAGEVNQLKPALLTGVRTVLTTGIADVIAGQWVHNGMAYIVVLNANETTSRTPTIAIPAVASGTATAMFSGRPTGMTFTGGSPNGTLSGTVNAMNVHVYSMPANA